VALSTRERLLRRGEKEVARLGHSAVSLRDVARQLSLSNMAAYRHFKDKDEFLSSIAERAFRPFQAALYQARIADTESHGQSSSLKRVAHAYLRFATESPHLFRLMFAGGMPSKSELEDQLDAKGGVYLELRSAVEEELDTNDLSEEDAEDEADMYAFFAWTVIHGFCFIDAEWFAHVPEQREGRLDALLDLSLATLKARQPSTAAS
jgi:AcrR family transcriptional regulator